MQSPSIQEVWGDTVAQPTHRLPAEHRDLAKSTALQYNSYAIKPNFMKLIKLGFCRDGGQNIRCSSCCSASEMTRADQHLSGHIVDKKTLQAS